MKALIKLFEKMKPREYNKIGSRPFFVKFERSTCCSIEAKFSAWNLLEIVYYGKFGFSRPDLDGNKLAIGECFARKARDRVVFSGCTEGPIFYF